MSENVAIALDIGNSTTVVGVILNGRQEIIANADGQRVTPTVVSFTENETLIGDIAVAHASQNPQNTIFNVLKYLGGKFDDKHVQEMVAVSPVKIVSDRGDPSFEINTEGAVKKFSPTEVLAKFIEKIKEFASNFVGNSVKSAVISIPSHFGDVQKRAVSNAAVLAGLKVLQVLHESTAAAMAYEADRAATCSNIFVFNMGGTSVEATVMTQNGRKYDVKKSSFDHSLGGNDFDVQLIDFLKKKFKQKEKMDIPDDCEAYWKLKRIAKTKKHNFSTSVKENVTEDCLYQGRDLVCSITRVRFEGLCSDLFMSVLGHVDTVLSLCELKASDIGEVILSGGATKMPKLVEGLKECFGDTPLKNFLNADEVAALGAARLADVLIHTQLDIAMTHLDLHDEETAGPSRGPVSKRNLRPVPLSRR